MLMTCFALCLGAGTMRSAILVLLEKNRLGDLLDAHALGCQPLDGEKFLCGADHSRGEKTCKHLGFGHESLMCEGVLCGKKPVVLSCIRQRGAYDAVVHGFGVLCVVVRPVCNVKKPCCFITCFFF